MKKYIGIITAIDEEFNAIKKIMTDISKEKIYNIVFIHGKINKKNVVLVKCGVGKVNSARVTQILTDKFNLDYIINTGSAGGLNSDLNIGDIVVGTELIQHDFDVRPFAKERGYISGTGDFFPSDKTLINKCKKVEIENLKIHIGKIASGDIFLREITMKEKIRKKFDCECVEMEGAAIAQVCFLNKIPFVVIRSISDIPNGNNNIDFEKFIKFASKNCAKFVEKLV